MSPQLQELMKIGKRLPKQKASELIDFAKFLEQQAKPAAPTQRKPKTKRNKVDGDAEWERIINDPRPRPKLEAEIERVRQAIRAGKTEPLDFTKL